jgi:hypothetical protein
MLLTLGGLGVWYLIDLVLLLQNQFKDSNNIPIINPKPILSWFVAVIYLLFIFGSGNEKHITDSSTTDSSKPNPQKVDFDVYLFADKSGQAQFLKEVDARYGYGHYYADPHDIKGITKQTRADVLGDFEKSGRVKRIPAGSYFYILETYQEDFEAKVKVIGGDHDGTMGYCNYADGQIGSSQLILK